MNVKLTTILRLALMPGLLVSMVSESKAADGILFSGTGMPTEQQALPLDLQSAFDSLKNVEALESSYIGKAGSPSENLQQLRVLLNSSHAEQLMLRLYDTGTLAAKLYAIIGLQLRHDFDLAQSLIQDAYQFQESAVTTIEGCIINPRKVQDLLRVISEGYYVKLFS